MIGFTEDEIDI